MTGSGTYTFKSGTSYTGQFTDGKMDGYGIMTYPSGNRYEGRFMNNSKFGSGTFWFARLQSL